MDGFKIWEIGLSETARILKRERLRLRCFSGREMKRRIAFCALGPPGIRDARPLQAEALIIGWAAEYKE